MAVGMVMNMIVAGVGVVMHESIFYDMETKRTLVGGRREVNASSVIGPGRLGRDC